jgi:NRPS condensation-like uncharacterized protein
MAAVRPRIPLNSLERNECLLDCGGPANLNFSVICTYKGPLTSPLLQKGLEKLASLHPHLRMRIEGVHFVETDRPVPFSEQPFRSRAQWKEVLKTDLRRFEIEREPLWRVTFLKGENEGQIIITFHHAIADGPCGMKAMHHLFQILGDLSVEFDRTFPPLESLFHLTPHEPQVSLEAKPRIRKEHEMRFEKKLLDEETTNKLLAWSKERGIKVNGLLTAALLLAMKNTGRFDHTEFSTLTVVNLRPYFTPPVSKDLMKLLRVSFASIYNPDGVDLTTFARHIHQDVHTRLEKGDHVLALKGIVRRLDQGPTPELVWQNTLQTPNTVAVTNLGALDFSGEYPGSPFSIQELSFVANTQPFFEHKDNLVLGALTFRGKTHLDLWGIGEHVNDQTLQAVLTEMEKILRDCLQFLV